MRAGSREPDQGNYGATQTTILRPWFFISKSLFTHEEHYVFLKRRFHFVFSCIFQ